MNLRVVRLILVFVMQLFALGLSAQQPSPEPTTPEQPATPAILWMEPIRGLAADTKSLTLKVSELTTDTKRLILRVHAEGIELSVLANCSLAGPVSKHFTVDSEVVPATQTAPEFLQVILDRRKESTAEFQSFSVNLPFRFPQTIGKGKITATGAVVSNGGNTVQEAVGYETTWGTSHFAAPEQIFGLLAVVVALIYLLSSWKPMKGFFTYLPPLIWMYFIPMLMTTFGVIPDQSALYSPFFSRIILPAVLVLLIIPTDIRTVKQLGGLAIAMMLIGTVGIVVGAISSFWLFNTFFGDYLPPETWKGIAGLSGSWIGGSPNMTAVFESLKTPPAIVGPIIIIDTVVAYSWLGFLVALSGYKERIDAFNKADTRIINDLSARLQVEQSTHQRAPQSLDVALMVGLAFGLSQLCLWIGPMIFKAIMSIENKDFTNFFKDVFSGYAIGILLITAVALFLSTTRVRKLDYCGASSIGNIGLYLMLTTYGAQADLRSILDVPILFALGVVWLFIHITVMAIGLRLLRAPVFLLAAGSMANIGGTASAPVVAASYYPSMAPVGLLMAILGGVLGTPVALIVVASVLKWIAGA